MFDVVVNDSTGIKNMLSISGTGQYSISYSGVTFASGTLPASVPMPVDLDGNIKHGLYNVVVAGSLHVFEYSYSPISLSANVVVNGFASTIRIEDASIYNGVTVLSKTLAVDEPQGVHSETSDAFTKTNIYSGTWQYAITSSIKQVFPSSLTVYDVLKFNGSRIVSHITKDNIFNGANALFLEYNEANKANTYQADKLENNVVAVNGWLNAFNRYLLANDAQNAYSCLEAVANIVSIPLSIELIEPFSFGLGSNVDTYLSKLNAQDTPRYIADMLGGTMEVKNNRIESKGSGKVSMGGEPSAYLQEKIDGVTIKESGGKLVADVNYTNLTPVPEKALGIDVGTTFNNVPISNVLDMLIYQYAYPIIALTAPTNRILEVGESVSGVMPVTWAIQNKQNVKAGGYKMIYMPSSTEVFTESDINATSGTFTHPATVRNTGSTVDVFKFYLTDTKNTERSFIVRYTWNHRIYYGESVSPSLNEAAVKALRVSGLFGSFLGKWQTNAGGYKYICVPADMGVPTRFRDVATGLLVPFNDPVSVQVTNQYGVNIQYNILRTVNILGGAVNIEIY